MGQSLLEQQFSKPKFSLDIISRGIQKARVQVRSMRLVWAVCGVKPAAAHQGPALVARRGVGATGEGGGEDLGLGWSVEGQLGGFVDEGWCSKRSSP